MVAWYTSVRSRNSMLPSRLVIAAFSLACAAAVYAQTSASLTGIVTTREGLAIPGITVTVSSPALQGTRSVVTGESGAYDFAALPPGEYRVEFAGQDFAPSRLHTVLRLSQTSRLDATLAPALIDVITITAAPPSLLQRPRGGAGAGAHRRHPHPRRAAAGARAAAGLADPHAKRDRAPAGAAQPARH